MSSMRSFLRATFSSFSATDSVAWYKSTKRATPKVPRRLFNTSKSKHCVSRSRTVPSRLRPPASASSTITRRYSFKSEM